MAAKMDSRLVVACILIFILNIITFIACQTTQPVGNTTTANAVTTDQTTTTEQTTTIAATTQPPTTTTTPLPTLPPTQVASITGLKSYIYIYVFNFMKDIWHVTSEYDSTHKITASDIATD